MSSSVPKNDKKKKKKKKVKKKKEKTTAAIDKTSEKIVANIPAPSDCCSNASCEVENVSECLANAPPDSSSVKRKIRTQKPQKKALPTMTREDKRREKEEIWKAAYGYDKKPNNGNASHKFWNTQPVPQPEDEGDGATKNEPIEIKTVDDVPAEPYALPSAYMWVSCNLKDPIVLNEVYHLLCENYVEDDDNMFRFDYSREFLNWALHPPGYIQEWHVGVRAKSGKKRLYGFITGIPVEIYVHDKLRKMAEINFLCVHKKLRGARLAPVLIKEVTRRVNRRDIWQAVYTAGVVLPKPIAKNRYYHRSLNPAKLIHIGFSRLQPKMSMSMTTKLYKLPTEPLTPGIRPFEEKDGKVCWEMLVTYLKKFALTQNFSYEEFLHWFTPREGVVNTYVVEDPETHKVTDMLSFYTLPSTIIGNKSYNMLKAAYSFYNVSNKTPWKDMMKDALILAKKLNFDVFNALNVMENDIFLKDLKFGIGDGHLQYYLYNWRCTPMDPKEVGIVLL